MNLELIEIKINELEIDSEYFKSIKNSFDEDFKLYGLKSCEEYEDLKMHNWVLKREQQRSETKRVLVSYTFPGRTRAMCNTLQKIGSLISQLGLIILRLSLWPVGLIWKGIRKV